MLAAAALSGGGLPLARPPQRPLPMSSTLGSVDGKILEHTGPPPLTELPLDPVALLAEPTIGSALDAQVAALGLDENDFGVTSAAALDLVPLARHGHRRRVARCSASPSLEGVGHQYPNG